MIAFSCGRRGTAVLSALAVAKYEPFLEDAPAVDEELHLVSANY